MSLLVLSSGDVSRVAASFTLDELQDMMAGVFQAVETACMPHRTAIAMDQHTALFMPARIGHATSIKIASVPASTDTRGLPASTLVLDEDTGAVKAIVNARSLTALRNAAGSLLSTRLVRLPSPALPNPPPLTHVVAFGAGAQIAAHLQLHLRAYPSLVRCTIVNRAFNSRVHALRESLEAKFTKVKFELVATSIPVSAPHALRTALRTANLVICATPSTSSLFPSAWLPTGAHVVLVGSYTPQMCEVGTQVVQRAVPRRLDAASDGRSATTVASLSHPNSPPRRQILLVDSIPACAREAGELIGVGVRWGASSSPDGTEGEREARDVREIGEFVRVRSEDGGIELVDPFQLKVGSAEAWGGHGADESHSRWNAPVQAAQGSDYLDDPSHSSDDLDQGPITLFKSVGLGAQDAAIASAVVRRAEAMGVGVLVAGYDSILDA
ncbi:hypothetical protein DXG03_002504 [Asterophora parasitica]|uniref:Ornithine cyclodeaminase n=1 Tax=Asterophora parasitica TaxID=117018 RepID=A0A9P7G3V5_9AGAR|nr:hypothetical protein DXG03_002504 [Asterophora parasitica]